MFSLPDALPLAWLKPAALVLVLLILLVAERLRPWRPAVPGRAMGNWGLALINAGIPRLLPLAALVPAADWAAAQGFGLLHALHWTGFTAGLAGFIAMDCLVYWQHRLLHVLPPLWRLHRVHHCDTLLDCSTGLRFHPLEALLSAALKVVAVVLLGLPPVAAALFALLLTAGALFSHANIRLAGRADALLRHLLVTPAMHRVHHSSVLAESQRNYGFFLPWWDHLFGSYQATAIAGEHLELGQAQWRATSDQQLPQLLSQPFRRP